MNPARLEMVLVFLGIALATAAVGEAADGEQPSGTGRTPGVGTVEARVGKAKVYGDGDISSDTQELSVGLEVRELFDRPLFIFGEGRVGQEKFRHYDLHHWGDKWGVGYALDPATDFSATYRLHNYSLFDIGPETDPEIRSVQGLSTVSALGLSFKHDRRDDPLYPTTGYRLRVGAEAGLHGLGGDYDFGRLESNFAFYLSPFRESAAGRWWEEVTFAEHLRLGWVGSFGSTDEVPFFERYFVGGASTVRGHRGRWLTPRRLDDQFVGGQAQLVNNIEARLPVFKETFRRRLSGAAFFDLGRAYHRFSQIGNFGYGLGVGLRYIVKIWQMEGVARMDLGFNPAREDDDSRARLHLTFGVPF